MPAALAKPLKLLLETFVEYLPPEDGEDRYIVTTFSHAQGAAISNERFKAQTAHTASCCRVASLSNKDMTLNTAEAVMVKRWRPKIYLSTMKPDSSQHWCRTCSCIEPCEHGRERIEG